jgi:hypothetical protein
MSEILESSLDNFTPSSELQSRLCKNQLKWKFTLLHYIISIMTAIVVLHSALWKGV